MAVNNITTGTTASGKVKPANTATPASQKETPVAQGNPNQTKPVENASGKGVVKSDQATMSAMQETSRQAQPPAKQIDSFTPSFTLGGNAGANPQNIGQISLTSQPITDVTSFTNSLLQSFTQRGTAGTKATKTPAEKSPVPSPDPAVQAAPTPQELAVLMGKGNNDMKQLVMMGIQQRQQQANEQNKPKRFDAKFYLEQNPDVAAAVKQGKITAIEHYTKFGIKEGRTPSADFGAFDAKFYLEQNPDVAAAVKQGKITAIEHYTKYGMKEGRAPSTSKLNEDGTSKSSAGPTALELQMLATSDNDGLKQYIMAQIMTRQQKADEAVKTTGQSKTDGTSKSSAGPTALELQMLATSDNDGLKQFIMAQIMTRQKKADEAASTSEKTKAEASNQPLEGMLNLPNMLGLSNPFGLPVLLSGIFGQGVTDGAKQNNAQLGNARKDTNQLMGNQTFQNILKQFENPKATNQLANTLFSGKKVSKAEALAQLKNVNSNIGAISTSISGQQFLSNNAGTILNNIKRSEANFSSPTVARAISLSGLDPNTARMVGVNLASFA